MDSDNESRAEHDNLVGSPLVTRTTEVVDGVILETEERVLSDSEVEEVQRNERVADRFSSPRLIAERKSDDPFEAIWRELVRFSGDDAARRAMTQRAIESETRLQGLRNEVRLADAYYLSYRDADEIIDSMLLYYGAYSLAKAVCYATLAEEEFARWQRRPTHGISSKIMSSLTDSQVSFQNNGTLQAFTSALGGESPREGQMDAVDLFRSVPELDRILRDLDFDGTTAMRVFPYEDDELSARILRGHHSIHIVADRDDYSNEDFEREIPIFHALAARGALMQVDARQISWKTKWNGVAELYFMAMRTPEGLFFERRLPGGYYVPEMAVHLILLHLLADFARYRPEQWINMVDRHTDQYSLVREFIHVSEYKFPNLVLNELTQRTFVFQHY